MIDSYSYYYYYYYQTFQTYYMDVNSTATDSLPEETSTLKNGESVLEWLWRLHQCEIHTLLILFPVRVLIW